MKWSHARREPVRYGITPAAFPELWLILLFAIALALPWLVRLISGWLAF